MVAEILLAVIPHCHCVPIHLCAVPAGCHHCLCNPCCFCAHCCAFAAVSSELDPSGKEKKKSVGACSGDDGGDVGVSTTTNRVRAMPSLLDQDEDDEEDEANEEVKTDDSTVKEEQP